MWHWWRRPLQTLEECQARYGDMFTLRLPHEGTWVFVSDPEAVKQVFTGDPNLLHAGAANIVLLPVLGEHSVLLLDEPEHMAQRKLMLPSFHGKRMQAYGEVMAQAAVEEIDRWPTDAPVRMRPRMQAVTLEVILRAVFGVDEGERLTRLRDELRSHAQPALQSAPRDLHGAARSRAAAALPAVPAEDRADRPAALRGDLAPGAALPTSPSGTTSSRSCCRRPTRTAAR